MDKMLPPSTSITKKILLEKALKLGINKRTAEGLLKNDQQKALKKIIDNRIKQKTDEMIKKSSRMFSNLEHELQRQSSLPTKNKRKIIKQQNDNLKEIKDYFRKQAEELNRRGPPIPLPNRILTSEQIAEIEENAQRNFKRNFLDVRRGVQHLPDRVSSGVSMNDSGYTPDSSESSMDFQGFKKRSKRSKRSKRTKRRTKRKTKKSKRRSRR